MKPHIHPLGLQNSALWPRLLHALSSRIGLLLWQPAPGSITAKYTDV